MSTVGSAGATGNSGRETRVMHDGAATGEKKKRGRPSGSKNRPKAAPTSTRSRFNPAFIPGSMIVLPRENICTKIMSFLQPGPRGICVLSAVGTVSSVTLVQANSSTETITHEAPFEIVSLTGSYNVLESGGQRSHSGDLRIMVVDSDGQIFCGVVAGLLIAAAPCQIVLGGYSLGPSELPNNSG